MCIRIVVRFVCLFRPSLVFDGQPLGQLEVAEDTLVFLLPRRHHPAALHVFGVHLPVEQTKPNQIQSSQIKPDNAQTISRQHFFPMTAVEF